MKYYKVNPREGTAKEISGEEYIVGKATPVAGGCLAVLAVLTLGVFIVAWKLLVGWARLTRRHPGVMVPVTSVVGAFGLFVALLFTPGSAVNAPIRSWLIGDASGALNNSQQVNTAMREYYGPYTTVESVTNVTDYHNGTATACVSTTGPAYGSQTEKLYLQYEWDFRGRYWQVKGAYADAAGC
jgi:hypothetical protein